jgi:hypothetical protein
MITDYINWKYFVVFLFLGIILVYLTVPKTDVVFRFPSPDNAGRFVYKSDDKHSCYKYSSTRVDCSAGPIPQDQPMH